MSEAHTESVRRPARAATIDLKKRLDELACGECSADEFVQETLLDSDNPTRAWDVLSYIDQRYRLGHLSDGLFLDIKSRLALNALKKPEGEFGNTVELVSAGKDPPREETAPLAPIRAARSLSPVPASVSVPEAAAAELKPGRILGGRYLLEELLGSGGMGTVFKAQDRRAPIPSPSTRRVALKVLREHTGTHADVQVQLRREFHCTQVLSHPNIVNVFELDRDGDLAYYTMELLSGEPLHKLLVRASPAGLPRRYAWGIIHAVGAALVHAHSRDIVHGDLKPQNVMVTEGGEVRVLDFGSSRTSTDGDEADAGVLTATPPYASCDVLEGGRPDTADDLYSLACLAYELLTGRHPYQSRNALQARADNEQPLRPAGLSNQTWRTLRAGLSWSRADRMIPVSEWLARLGVEISPQRLPPFSPAPVSWGRRVRRLPWRDFAAPLAVAVLALALLPLSFHAQRPAPTAVVAASPATPPLTATASRAAPTAQEPRASTPVRTPAIATAPPAVKPAAAASSVVKSPVMRPATIPPLSRDASRTARDAVAVPSVTLTARRRGVQRGANFVEVQVRGNRARQGFTWWTEDGSARGGVDYVAQARTTRSFTGKRSSATLYVRLLPTTGSRSESTFYIRVAAPNGTSTGIDRTAIVLRPAR